MDTRSQNHNFASFFLFKIWGKRRASEMVSISIEIAFSPETAEDHLELHLEFWIPSHVYV